MQSDTEVKRRKFLFRATAVLTGLAAVIVSKREASAQATATSLPIGTIIAFAGSKIPDGWLACDGKAYDARQGSNYYALFQVIGVSYGSPGVSQFNVPNLNNGAFIRGSGTLGQSGGRESHNHTVTDQGANSGAGFRHDGSQDNLGVSDTQNHLPPYVTAQYIIKYTA